MPRNVDVSEIYSATIELFCERGFGGTTTREIADRAGVNEVTLFRRFGSKAGLIEAAIGDTLSDVSFGRMSPGDDVRSDLLEVVRRYLDTYRKHSGLALTLFAQVPQHPELRTVTPFLLRNLQGVARILARHQSNGQLKPGDPVSFAVALIAPLAVMGFMKEMGLGTGHEGLDVENYVQTYLQGHGPNSED
ncbi:TetR/AcrR family transcriptional regulator [Roseibium sp. LAB1]